MVEYAETRCSSEVPKIHAYENYNKRHPINGDTMFTLNERRDNVIQCKRPTTTITNCIKWNVKYEANEEYKPGFINIYSYYNTIMCTGVANSSRNGYAYLLNVHFSSESHICYRYVYFQWKKKIKHLVIWRHLFCVCNPWAWFSIWFIHLKTLETFKTACTHKPTSTHLKQLPIWLICSQHTFCDKAHVSNYRK